MTRARTHRYWADPDAHLPCLGDARSEEVRDAVAVGIRPRRPVALGLGDAPIGGEGQLRAMEELPARQLTLD